MTSSHAWWPIISDQKYQQIYWSLSLATYFSLIWNHPQHFSEIPIAHQRGLSELAFVFRFLRRQDVTQLCVATLHLPRRRLLEALGSALVRLQFRHKNPREQLTTLAAVSFILMMSEERRRQEKANSLLRSE
jgi:hypothetical protein